MEAQRVPNCILTQCMLTAFTFEREEERPTGSSPPSQNLLHIEQNSIQPWFVGQEV